VINRGQVFRDAEEMKGKSISDDWLMQVADFRVIWQYGTRAKQWRLRLNQKHPDAELLWHGRDASGCYRSRRHRGLEIIVWEETNGHRDCQFSLEFHRTGYVICGWLNPVCSREELKDLVEDLTGLHWNPERNLYG
jgi:hypothetical protein